MDGARDMLAGLSRNYGISVAVYQTHSI